jgi:predicted nucleic acid-binding protein
VALKWQLDDEQDVDRALALRDDFLLRGEVDLVAPTLFAYELTNGIHAAARRLRLAARTADAVLQSLLECEVALVAPDAERILKTARRLGLSPYDAAYVELAERLDAEFWTADGHMHRAASELKWVRWIGDYPLPD